MSSQRVEIPKLPKGQHGNITWTSLVRYRSARPYSDRHDIV